MTHLLLALGKTLCGKGNRGGQVDASTDRNRVTCKKCLALLMDRRTRPAEGRT